MAKEPVERTDTKRACLYDLPSEIYCVIFIHARDASLILDPHTLNKRPIEITISHVCQLWRTISLSYPVLWNTFRYSVPTSQRVWPTDRLWNYLQRSQPQLLELWLNFRGDQASHWRKTHQAMFMLLLPETNRWRRITILLDPNDPLLSQCRDFDILCPENLEHFALCPQSSLDSDDRNRDRDFSLNPAPKIFILGAPHLTSIRLDSSSYRTFLPPLSNVVTLRLENPYSRLAIYHDTLMLPSLIQLLGMPSLENLSLSGFVILGLSEDDSKPTILMKNLRDFRCGSVDVARLLTSIVAPRLQYLTLKSVPFQSHLPPKSFPSLETLVLLNCDVPWQTFSSSLSSKIKHLTVSDNSEGTFYQHALSEISPIKWPDLQSLSCNIQPVPYIRMYLQLALLRGSQPLGSKKFTLRVNRRLVDMWKERDSDPAAQLQEACNLEMWDDISPLVSRQWPYAEERDVDHVYDKVDHDQFRALSYH